MPSKPTPEESPLLAPTPSPVKALSSFARLNSVVRLYTPPADSPVSPLTHPTTILFCSWMNAFPKHIEYYTNNYKKLFPSARIILVTITTKHFIFETEAKRRKDVGPAVTALLAAKDKDRLLVHSLSNGGGKRIYNVASAYKTATGNVLPMNCQIIDSSPGVPRFRRDLHALTVPARKLPFFSRIAYVSAIFAVVSVVYVVINWLPRTVWYQLVWAPTDAFNDKRIFNGTCVKGYVYSKEDEAIDYRDVEAHAKVAETKGYRVQKKLIEGPGHVQMFKGKGGEDEYWGWVLELWGSSVGKK